MSTTPRPRVAIALGDPAGIGPEIALKTALDESVRSICEPVLFGDPGVLAEHARACGLERRLSHVAIRPRPQLAPGELAIGKIAAAHGRAALDSARAAIEAALAGEVDAVIAAPQTEAAIKAAGIEFDGYPSFVARCTGVAPEDAFLMLCFDDVRIVHTTLHVSLRRALELVTRERVERAIRAADSALRRIGVSAPRLAVAGVNPHASEGGLFGDEEARIVGPAIAAARAAGMQADGPFGADTMFHKTGYDAFVVMYHDQGHIAAKLRAFDRTAGMTIGTPVVFSSVAHGSALDIAGQNKANHRAMVEAVRRVVGARR
jgi:4-hydroxythreonine-4-phosphate dehydrogenase